MEKTVVVLSASDCEIAERTFFRVRRPWSTILLLQPLNAAFSDSLAPISHLLTLMSNSMLSLTIDPQIMAFQRISGVYDYTGLSINAQSWSRFQQDSFVDTNRDIPDAQTVIRAQIAKASLQYLTSI